MKETFIHPTAIVYPNVFIGDGCYIGPYCIVGSPPEHADIDPFAGSGRGVWIGDGVRMYGHNTVDAPMGERTTIGSGCILMKGAHVGHDAVICADTTLACGAKIGGYSLVGAMCNIGLNAALHQFTELADGIMVGALAFVKGKHDKQFRILAGVPARDIGENIRLINKLKDAQKWQSC